MSNCRHRARAACLADQRYEEVRTFVRPTGSQHHANDQKMSPVPHAGLQQLRDSHGDNSAGGQEHDRSPRVGSIGLFQHTVSGWCPDRALSDLQALSGRVLDTCGHRGAAAPETGQSLETVLPQTLIEYVNELHTAAGAPSRRVLGSRAHLSKSTVSAAFSGTAVPTWAVTEALTRALGGNVQTALTLWSAARSTASAAQRQAPTWLTEIRQAWPEIAGCPGVEESCRLAMSDVKSGINSAWNVLRVATLQISAKFYEAIPGSWSSDVVRTLRRAEDEGHVPAGIADAAAQVHIVYVPAQFPDASTPLGAALQTIVLAYRVAAAVWECTHLEPEAV